MAQDPVVDSKKKAGVVYRYIRFMITELKKKRWKFGASTGKIGKPE